eukprot:2003741-Prymnesium_polylepis.1
MGQEEHAWLEDDENLKKYENNELTASDRRILLATWYCKAYHRSNQGGANRKYFEHAGGLLTADGTDHHLIKLEGVPKGKPFSWEDDPLDALPPEPDAPPEVIADPEDVGPQRDYTTRTVEDEEEVDNVLEDNDDDDDEDAPPAPRDAPVGFRIVDEP